LVLWLCGWLLLWLCGVLLLLWYWLWFGVCERGCGVGCNIFGDLVLFVKGWAGSTGREGLDLWSWWIPVVVNIEFR
jgi:hypothetical protein